MSKISKKYTYYLFGKPSFITNGIGRIFDFTGSINIYNKSETENEADAKALYLDWYSVGQDLKIGLDKYERNRGKVR